MSKRIEVFLALSALLQAGPGGIKRKSDPGKPVNMDVFLSSRQEHDRLKIHSPPKDLNDAFMSLKKDKVIQTALGGIIFINIL